MLCQRCSQNEAEVHFIQTVNGEKSELMLCAPCAAENGFGISPISFTSFLQSFIDTGGAIGSYPNQEVKKELSCQNCGLTLSEIKNSGKAGCAHCYSVFKAQMDTIIKNVQAGNTHTGRFPKKAKNVYKNREISVLRKRLAAVIELEQYEEAAKIRDSIRALEGGRENG